MKSQKVDILVATPGRLLHYLQKGVNAVDTEEKDDWSDESEQDDFGGTDDDNDIDSDDDDDYSEEDSKYTEERILHYKDPKKARNKRKEMEAKRLRAEHTGKGGESIQDETDGLLDLGFVETLVLDECDKMLEMGFFPYIKKLYRILPKPKKVMKGGKITMTSLNPRYQAYSFFLSICRCCKR